MANSHQFHYTDDRGYKAICSQETWVFKAEKPPGKHPVGAYFTTLPPETVRLANRLRIPKRKIENALCFEDQGDLTPIDGDRGRFIFYSPTDYCVMTERQIAAGPRDAVQEKLQ